MIEDEKTNIMTEGKTYVFVGKRNKGKSHLVSELYQHDDIPINTALLPNLTYKPHVPKTFSHAEFTPESIDEIFLKRQQDMIQNKQQNIDKLLIIDDCLSPWKDDNIKNIFMNGPHTKWDIFHDIKKHKYKYL